MRDSFMSQERIVAFIVGLPLILLSACSGSGEVVLLDGGFEGRDGGVPIHGDAGLDAGAKTQPDSGTGVGADSGSLARDAGSGPADAGTIPVNNASYVTASGPTSVLVGQSFAVQVTMLNTGTTTWSQLATDTYSLGTQDPQDNMTWGTNRLPVPAG